jgi:hypothetical protein
MLNRWLPRIRLSTLAILLPICIAVTCLTFRWHWQLLFESDEPLFLKREFYHYRWRIFWVFTPIFAMIFIAGVLGLWWTLANVRESKSLLAGLLLASPLISTLIYSVWGAAVVFPVSSIGTLALIPLVFQGQERSFRLLGVVVSVNLAWAICLALYAYSVLRYASEL